MKAPVTIIALCALASFAPAEEAEMTREEIQLKLEEGASEVAGEQDELSADVQQLVIEQTVPKVIELLSEVEDIMDETIDRLDQTDTGGETLAAQTEVIEKIHAAAKEKQKQGGGSPSGSAMMDMMERMMGKTPDADKKSNGKGDKPGDSSGEGQTGLSDAENDLNGGQVGDNTEARRVPKASGNTSLEIPAEFRKAFDAYNRGAEQKIK